MDGFYKTRDRSGTEEMTRGLSTYSEAVVADKYPSLVDGLKTIHRRILWKARECPDVVSLAKLLGSVMEIHTSGDQTIVESIIRLSQDFVMGEPFIYIQGKNGEYYNPKGYAAFRYLKVAISEFAYDLFFKGISLKTIPMEQSKDFSGLEPRYLIPKLPTALLIPTLSVGVGFKGVIPKMSLASVCDLVMKYAEAQKNNWGSIPDPKIYGKLLVPSYPIRNIITNKEELVQEYTLGNFNAPICTDGVVDLSGDSIILRSVAYGGPGFDKATSKIREILKSKSAEAKELWAFIKDAKSLSAEDAEFAFQLVKGRNPFLALERLSGLLGLHNKIHPCWLFANSNNKLVELTPLQVLMDWYNERHISIVGGLKYELNSLVKRKRETEAILLICDNTNEVIDIIRDQNNKDEADIVHALVRRFKDRHLTAFQGTVIAREPLKRLARYNRNELLTELETLSQNIDEVMSKFSGNRIDEIIYNDAQYFKKSKYDKTVKTRYSSDFKGYVQYGNLGIVHFFDEEDMYNLLQSKGWGSTRKEIHLYNSKSELRYYIRNGKLIPMINPSKEIMCEGVVCYPDNRQNLSLCINDNGSTAVVEKNVDGLMAGWHVFPITKEFYAIHRSGDITVEKYTNFTIRKTVSTGGKTDIVYALPNTYADVVVLHMNSSEKNTIRIDRVLTSLNNIGKIYTPASGNLHILGVFETKTRDIYLNIPDDCLKNLNLSQLIVKNIAQMFSTGENHQYIDLTKSGKWSHKLEHTVVHTCRILNLSDD